ncbi:MAG TPA: S8 family serine peptidase [Actinomycetota bacterium]|nr:S8 family serine peptidase [Actinomycetota bacterium]
MKKLSILASALVIVAATGAAAESSGREPQVPARYRPLVEKASTEGTVRVLVSARDEAAQRALRTRLGGVGADVLVDYEAFPVLLVEADASLVRDLATHDGVTGLAEDVLLNATLDSSIPLVNVDDVHVLGFAGSGSTVAILDTGIDVDHPIFAGRIVAQACFSNVGGALGETSLCPSGMPSQTGAGAADAETPACLVGAINECSHGSHVAAIAAGNATGVGGAPGPGVAPGAEIVAVQVFTRISDAGICNPEPTPCFRTATSDQLLGLEHVSALQGTLGSPIVAANLSLGGGVFSAACDGRNRSYTAAVDTLLAQNIATVVAAGNNGFQNAVGFPACISNAVTVGATNDFDGVASFSDRGSLLDVFAPGVQVTSAVPDDTFTTFSGTSMAAPHVAGLWALLRQVRPTATVGQVLGALRATGRPISYPSGGTTVTTPRMDGLAAYTALTTEADLTAALVASSPGPGRVGTPLSFDYTVTNAGPDPAPNVRFDSSMTLGAPITSVVPSQGTCGPGGSGFTCSLGELAAGDAVTIQLEVTPNRGGRVRAFGSAFSSASDPNPLDNEAGTSARVKVVCTVDGTAGDDVLAGTNGIDVLCGKGGNDVLRGKGGDDILIGGPGDDRLIGGGGGDLLLGKGGNDLLKGGPGFDTCKGGRGKNKIRACEA